MISTVKKVLTTAVLTLVFAFYANANDTNLYKMHSLFLYNFTKHIQWSNAEGEVFTIGVYNNQSKGF
jgi:hypothetical protein